MFVSYGVASLNMNDKWVQQLSPNLKPTVNRIHLSDTDSFIFCAEIGY